jgi:hypothetical protein
MTNRKGPNATSNDVSVRALKSTPGLREEEIRGQVLEIIAQLVSEVHSSFGTAPTAILHSSLDKDLALARLIHGALSEIGCTSLTGKVDRISGMSSPPPGVLLGG